MSTGMLPAQRRPAALALGVLGLLFAVAGMTWWMGQVEADVWLPAVYVPVILLVTLPLMHRMAVLEDDRTLFWLLVLGLGLKFIGALARYYFAFDVYGGNADAGGYHQWGITLSESFRSLSFETELHGYTDTDFIRLLTGVIYTFTGASLLGGFILFAWFSFLGQLLFYRAFVIAMPGGRRRMYAAVVFFLPTMLFWPSSIGKEAWMVLTLGMAAYGGAKILTSQHGVGLVVATLGLAGAGVARPHIGGLMTVALIVAFLFQRRNEQGVARVLRLLVIPALAVVMLVAISAAQDLLNAEDVASALENTADKTSGGGSSFSPVLVRTPLDVPLATFTVLFRPHPLEVSNAQMAMTALEGMALLALAAWNLRRMLRIIPRWRDYGHLVMAVAFTGMFIVAYSSIANFGILARQRAQLIPVLAILLALPIRPAPRSTGRTPA